MTSEEWSAIEDDIYASGRIYKLIADLAACEKDRGNLRDALAYADHALRADRDEIRGELRDEMRPYSHETVTAIAKERDALLRSIASWKREELEWDAEREGLKAKLEKCIELANLWKQQYSEYPSTLEGMVARVSVKLCEEELIAALAETKEEARTIEDRSSEIAFSDDAETKEEK
jgi:hypothetical protein